MVNHPNRNGLLKSRPGADEIKKLRIAHGLTQKEFADLSFSSNKAVEAWEAGSRNMHPVTWQYYRHILGVKEIPFGAKNK